MIQRIFKLNTLIIKPGFIRGITGVQSLYNNTNFLKSDDEDISEDVIAATRKFEPIGNKNNDNLTKKYLVNTNIIYRIRYYLSCTEEEAGKILKENPGVEALKKLKLVKQIDHLTRNGITIRSMIENPFLLTMDEIAFITKLEIASKFLRKSVTSGLMPEEINDVVPLLQVSKLVLTRALRLHEIDKKVEPTRNRIYFLSKKMNIDPEIVTKYFATHMFIFGVPWEILEENLETLLRYEIDPVHILRDLWVFKYDPEKLKERFELCRNAGRKNLRPWMVRCKIEVLLHSNELYSQNKHLLGENTVIEYLSQRLNYDVATMKIIALKHPTVLKCRVTKIKEVLDYLLDEAKFETYEIANTIRIITHSLETTKERLEELARLGCRPSTLTIVCRSQNEYNKFIEDWIEKSSKY